MLDKVQVHFKIPAQIKEGLISGEFVRRGGIIQSKSGKIWGWLKESKGFQDVIENNSKPPMLPNISSLGLQPQILITQLLNLGVSAIGFAIMNKKLNSISQNIEKLHNSVEKIISSVEWVSRKIDIQMIAKMSAGIEQARRALLARSSENKRQGLQQATDHFIEAGNFFDKCLSEFVGSGRYLENAKLYKEYIDSAVICRMGPIQCSLNLEEPEIAQEDLKTLIASVEKLSSDFKEKFLNFDVRVIQKITSKASNNPDFLIIHKEIKAIKTSLVSYESEINFISKHSISYQDWAKIGQNMEEPDIILIEAR